MPTPLSPEEIERIAIKRASAKLGWYIHACVYVAVNAFLYFSWNLGFRSREFNVFPMMGWGLGLALHFVSVFLLGSGSGLRERLVERERERLQREQNRP
ncbi:MAG TPA: 2TM domain-containing protein [Ramlibacter sp.]|nr:2TM domain-containing protein [Ramlibacter sp.]